ncbi:MAG: sugar phosphate nucleotidyltransferase [Nanoarchaeota archaeon]
MKALILAAGFGTRLEKEIKRDTSGEYNHLIAAPKPLLPIAGKPLINYWMERFGGCEEIDATYVVVNGSNYASFKKWARECNFPYGKANLVNNGRMSNETRLGAIADIALVVREKEIDDDLLVVGGDTLFYPDFNLKEVIADFYRRNGEIITCYLVSDGEVQKRGILERSSEGRVVGFLEKPSLQQTASRLASPPFYIYRRETLSLLETYLRQAGSLEERDAPGRFVSWLYQRVPVYAFEISGRFDVGGLQDYRKADEFFKRAIS